MTLAKFAKRVHRTERSRRLRCPHVYVPPKEWKRGRLIEEPATYARENARRRRQKLAYTWHPPRPSHAR